MNETTKQIYVDYRRLWKNNNNKTINTQRKTEFSSLPNELNDKEGMFVKKQLEHPSTTSSHGSSFFFFIFVILRSLSHTCPVTICFYFAFFFFLFCWWNLHAHIPNVVYRCVLYAVSSYLPVLFVELLLLIFFFILLESFYSSQLTYLWYRLCLCICFFPSSDHFCLVYACLCECKCAVCSTNPIPILFDTCLSLVKCVCVVYMMRFSL